MIVSNINFIEGMFCWIPLYPLSWEFDDGILVFVVVSGCFTRYYSAIISWLVFFFPIF